jgi:hypothetical protein
MVLPDFPFVSCFLHYLQYAAQPGTATCIEGCVVGLILAEASVHMGKAVGKGKLQMRRRGASGLVLSLEQV